MVMTKENSFFVFCALMALLAVNPWARFGVVTSKLLLVSVLGPFAGVTLLIMLAGGTSVFIEVFTLFVSKAQHLEYAIKIGDGPWYRYLVDLLLISPIILLLAIGGRSGYSPPRDPTCISFFSPASRTSSCATCDMA